MNKRGLTLMELLVAVAVLSVTITLALRTLVLTDRVTTRGQARLQATLDRVALQSQLRRDIWAAEGFTSAGPGSATFTIPDGPPVTYSATAGQTSRTCAGIETLYSGTVTFEQGRNALIHVSGRDAAEWSFSARMRNASCVSAVRSRTEFGARCANHGVGRSGSAPDPVRAAGGSRGRCAAASQCPQSPLGQCSIAGSGGLAASQRGGRGSAPPVLAVDVRTGVSAVDVDRAVKGARTTSTRKRLSPGTHNASARIRNAGGGSS